MSIVQKLVFVFFLYDAQAIQKAAYRSLNAFTLDMSIEGDSYVCVLLGNITTDADAFNKAVESFKKDVLDYQLRGQLKAETEPVRNLILGVAFANSGLQ